MGFWFSVFCFDKHGQCDGNWVYSPVLECFGELLGAAISLHYKLPCFTLLADSNICIINYLSTLLFFLCIILLILLHIYSNSSRLMDYNYLSKSYTYNVNLLSSIITFIFRYFIYLLRQGNQWHYYGLEIKKYTQETIIVTSPVLVWFISRIIISKMLFVLIIYSMENAYAFALK